MTYFGRKSSVTPGILLLTALGLAGCAPSQQELMARDRLQQARHAYRAAASDRDVQTYAQIPLNDAATTLHRAETTDDFAEMEARAYVAEKKAQTAVAIAEGKRAENEIQILQKENTAALLRRREREAQVAKGEAAEKTRELERVREEARTRTGDAEHLKAQAEARAKEAERGTREAEARAREAEAARAEAERLTRELSEQKGRQAELTREADKSRAENAQLVKQLAVLKAKQTERGVVVTLGDVLFPFGKAGLSPQARRSIAKLNAFLGTHPNRNVVIEGFTDNVGSDAANLKLSEKRAQAVKKMLTDRGIDPQRISAKGYGKSRPVASNTTPHGRQLNRRVEVIILNEGVPLPPPSQ